MAVPEPPSRAKSMIYMVVDIILALLLIALGGVGAKGLSQVGMVNNQSSPAVFQAIVAFAFISGLMLGANGLINALGSISNRYRQ